MKRVLFIGITCGLSAPFVAGQLNYCIQHSEVFVPVLLGFNPTALARCVCVCVCMCVCMCVCVCMWLCYMACNASTYKHANGM